MTVTVEGILLLALVLLPGAYARVAAVRLLPEPWTAAYRSQLEEFLEVLLYAVVNALITVVPLAAIAVAHFNREKDLRNLIESGLAAFPASQRVDGLVWLIVYFGVALVVAEVTGTSQMLTRARAFLATLFGYRDPFERAPIWAWAFGDDDVPVRVLMKSGVTYRGIIGVYPIVDDNIPRDFSLKSAWRIERNAEPEEIGIVLLNSADCLAVEVRRDLLEATAALDAALDSGAGIRPPRRRTWGDWMQESSWLLLSGFALWTLALLSNRPDPDELIRLLAFSMAAVAIGATAAVLRLEARLRGTADHIETQRSWLLGVAAQFFATIGFLNGWPMLLAGSLLAAGSISVILSPMGSAIVRLMPRAAERHG